MHMVDSVMDYGLLEEEEKWALPGLVCYILLYMLHVCIYVTC